MNAGRELDALVAEKVMDMGSQWTVRQMPDGSFEPTGDVWYECPEFSTDIADAWKVVEALRTRAPQGYQFELHLNPPAETRRPVYEALAIFQQDFYRYRRFCGTSEVGSVPHAICLAALRAVGALQ